MKYPSKLLNAYYDSFHPLSENARDIAEEIAGKTMEAYQQICVNTILSHVNIINEIIQRTYIKEADTFNEYKKLKENHENKN